MPSSESALLVLAKPVIHIRSSELLLVGLIHTLSPIFLHKVVLKKGPAHLFMQCLGSLNNSAEELLQEPSNTQA